RSSHQVSSLAPRFADVPESSVPRSLVTVVGWITAVPLSLNIRSRGLLLPVATPPFSSASASGAQAPVLTVYVCALSVAGVLSSERGTHQGPVKAPPVDATAM